MATFQREVSSRWDKGCRRPVSLLPGLYYLLAALAQERMLAHPSRDRRARHGLGAEAYEQRERSPTYSRTHADVLNNMLLRSHVEGR